MKRTLKDDVQGKNTEEQQNFLGDEWKREKRANEKFIATVFPCEIVFHLSYYSLVILKKNLENFSS